MSNVSGASNTTYSYGMQQSFKQEVARRAAEYGYGNISVFMNAMDTGMMQTSMDELLSETGGTLPSNYDCQSFADKLFNFVKSMFNQNPNEVKTFDEALKTDSDDTEDKTSAELDFSFNTEV